MNPIELKEFIEQYITQKTAPDAETIATVFNNVLDLLGDKPELSEVENVISDMFDNEAQYYAPSYVEQFGEGTALNPFKGITIPAAVIVDDTITSGGQNPVKGGVIFTAFANLTARIEALEQNSGGGNQNTTPAPPTVTVNGDLLSASHALGISEILVSVNNGAYTAYTDTINMGTVDRPEGYWKFKIKAATGRNESAVVNSPAYTAAVVSEGLIADKMLSFGSNQTYDNVTGNYTGDGGANGTLANTADTSTSSLTVTEIDFKYNPAWQGNFTNIGLSRIAGADIYQNYDVGVLILDNLNLNIRYFSDTDGGNLGSSGYTIPANTNSRVKIKLTNGGNAKKFVEFFTSTDNGATWTSRGAAIETQIPNTANIYAHFFMASNSKVDNIKYSG